MKDFITILILCSASCYINAKVFTSYACEGQKMKLFCHLDEVIRIKSADYGRSNASICQFFEDADLDLNCHTKKAKQIVSMRCNGKRKCLLGAINYLFGDPCPGQVKYLEATYRCQKKNTPNNINPTISVDIPNESNDLLDYIDRLKQEILMNDGKAHEVIFTKREGKQPVNINKLNKYLYRANQDNELYKDLSPQNVMYVRQEKMKPIITDNNIPLSVNEYLARTKGQNEENNELYPVIW